MFDWGLNSGDLFTRFLDSLTAPFQDWLSQHPILLWLATNPLLSFPVNLLRWLWQGIVFLLSRPFAPKPVVGASFVNPPMLNSQDRLTEVLNRLEVLRQEQDELLKEVKSLLAKDSEK